MNQGGVNEIIRAYSKHYRKRNYVIISATVLTILALFSVFCMIQSRLETDTLKSIRENGSASDVSIINVTDKQYMEISELDYIDQIGIVRRFAKTYDEKDSNRVTPLAVCEVLDQIAYDKMQKIAYGNVVGKYPQKKNEVMLSTRYLKMIGISDPEIGMEVPLIVTYDDWNVNGGQETIQNYQLAGYYTDYVDVTTNLPILYFSNQFLESVNAKQTDYDLLLQLKEKYYQGSKVEKRLYEDITLEDNQKIQVKDSDFALALNQILGGAGVAVTCLVVILMSVYMVINSIFEISLDRDIRQYGLLKIVGATPKQIQKIISGQMIPVLEMSLVLGTFLCVGFRLLILPRIFGSLYVEAPFPIWMLILTIAFVVLMLMIAGGNAGKKAKKISAIEAYRYAGVDPKSIKVKNFKVGNRAASLWLIAKRNVKSNRRKFRLTMLSLFIGCEVALCAIVIGRGTDITNKIEKNPDFTIEAQKAAVENFQFESTVRFDSDQVINSKFITKLLESKCIDNTSASYVYGTYASLALSYEEDEALRPRRDASRGTGNANTGATVQIVDDIFIDKLEKYVSDNDLKINLNALRSGEGMCILHHHELSPAEEQDAETQLDVIIHLYPKHEYSQNESVSAIEMKNAGYLDITQKHFPELDTTWVGNGVNYFIVSEKGFSNMGLQKQIFKVRFNSEIGEENQAEKTVKTMLQEENQQTDIETYLLTTKKELLEQSEDYIRYTRIIMGMLSAILILVGIMNYINTMVTDIRNREAELHTMSNIGMTRKQLYQMLFFEGEIYIFYVVAMIMTVGAVILVFMERTMKYNLEYFRFNFPVVEVLILFGVLSGIGWIIPRILYQRK